MLPNRMPHFSDMYFPVLSGFIPGMLPRYILMIPKRMLHFLRIRIIMSEEEVLRDDA